MTCFGCVRVVLFQELCFCLDVEAEAEGCCTVIIRGVHCNSGVRAEVKRIVEWCSKLLCYILIAGAKVVRHVSHSVLIVWGYRNIICRNGKFSSSKISKCFLECGNVDDSHTFRLAVIDI